MRVNVIMLVDNGITTHIEVVKKTGTAEATYEHLAEIALGKELFEELREESNTIESLLPLVEYELESLGKEILWFEDIKVNKFG